MKRKFIKTEGVQVCTYLLYMPVWSKLYFWLAGNWYAMTGYGVAFPRNSKHFANFNRKVMDYSENGKTEQEQRKNGKKKIKKLR